MPLIGNRIKLARRAAGLSSALETRIGGRVTAQAIGKYECTSRRTGISDGIRPRTVGLLEECGIKVLAFDLSAIGGLTA